MSIRHIQICQSDAVSRQRPRNAKTCSVLLCSPPAACTATCIAAQAGSQAQYSVTASRVSYRCCTTCVYDKHAGGPLPVVLGDDSRRTGAQAHEADDVGVLTQVHERCHLPGGWQLLSWLGGCLLGWLGVGWEHMRARSYGCACRTSFITPATASLWLADSGEIRSCRAKYHHHVTS
jgi:hypothetical protein